MESNVEINLTSKVDVSIILPIHNGSKWIKPCFDSILLQTAVATLQLEVCVCNDSSTDDTDTLLNAWKERFEELKIIFKTYKNESGNPKGVGYAKNRAIGISSGNFLCFQDIDDIMLPERIQKQYDSAMKLPENTLIGCRFLRTPEDSTKRYTKWANGLNDEELKLQIYTSNGPTVIMPTWFCHRRVYDSVGEFSELGKGTPEDLIFFYKHLDLDGKIHRVADCLLNYHYHETATTFSIHEDTIWKLRLNRLQSDVLPAWPTFTIWNAGKQGKKLYNSLSADNRKKVVAMCDVDEKKIKQKKYSPFDAKRRKVTNEIDIIHFKDARPPLVICVKLDMSDGVFEENLRSLNLTEGKDYVNFS